MTRKMEKKISDTQCTREANWLRHILLTAQSHISSMLTHTGRARGELALQSQRQCAQLRTERWHVVCLHHALWFKKRRVT